MEQAYQVDEPKSLRQQIRLACYTGDLPGLQALVAQGVTVEDLRAENSEILSLAYENGGLPMVQYLMAQGLTVEDLRVRHEILSLACDAGL